MTVARLETVSKHPSIVLASANGGDVAANPEAPILEAVPNSTDRARAYKMRCADSALLGAAPLSPVPCKAVRSGQNHSLKCPSSCSKRSVARRAFLASQNTSSAQRGVSCWAETAQAPSTRSPLRLIQHKDEAFWFYRFLSIVYDKIVNPGHWTEDMRSEALQPAQLDRPTLKVADVGGGTGFCTLGVVEHVRPECVTLVDQSPHQLAKARKKPKLRGVTIMEGDAEDLPLGTDAFDRYVSAGSIEYWPEPQRGIAEAYRIIKPGGVACLIGPVHPTFWLSSLFADAWMLFPTEEEYLEWFRQAGFEDVQIKRIGPKWYRGVRRHGLIMGCSVTGRKSKPGKSPLGLGPKLEEAGKQNTSLLRKVSFPFRLLLGSTAGFYYFLLPVYMWIKNLVWPRRLGGF